MVRGGHLQLDYLKCSFEFTKDRFVLGVFSSSPKTSFILGVPLGSSKTRCVPIASLDYMCFIMHQFMGTSLQDPNGKLTDI